MPVLQQPDLVIVSDGDVRADWLGRHRCAAAETPLDCAIARITGPIARECDQQAADIARRRGFITEAEHLAREMCQRFSADDAFEVLRIALRIVEEIE